MQTTWIVAADSSRARIFETHGKGSAIQEIEDFANPEGRSQNRELDSDARGRYYGKGERYQGHTAPPHVDAVEHQTELFTKTLAEYLNQGRIERRYDRLFLFAPPKFLGLLRQNITKQVQELIEEEINKDISWFNEADLREYIKENTSSVRPVI